MSVTDYLLHGDGPRAISTGTQAILPYLTAGGFLMLGWRLRHERRAVAGLAFANAGAMLAASLVSRYRGSRDARRTARDARYDRGRTIYRNTPTPGAGFDMPGLP
jgi:hypothetical protein